MSEKFRPGARPELDASSPAHRPVRRSAAVVERMARPRKRSSTSSTASRRPGGPDFVAPAERIATFDNDGTLWAEQPVYVQVAFALDRVKALAPQHPEWKTEAAVQRRSSKAT